jgi:hypothetical protein
MAGNITGTNAANIGAVMTYAAKESLPVLKANLGLARFVRRYTDEVAGVRSQSVTIPAAGKLNAVDKAANTAVTFQNPEGTAPTITLNKHKIVPIRIEDYARAISNPDILAMYLQSALVAVAEQVEADVIAEAQGAFTANVGTYGTDVTSAVLQGAGKAIFDSKGGYNDRLFVCSSKDEMALRNDTSLASYFANADPAAVREGIVARIHGFDILPTQLIQPTGSGPAQTKNLALRRDAVWVATRALESPQDSGVVVESVTDPDLSFTFRVMLSYDHAQVAHILTVDCLYGVKAMRPEFGVLVKG